MCDQDEDFPFWQDRQGKMDVCKKRGDDYELLQVLEFICNAFHIQLVLHATLFSCNSATTL